MHPFARVLYIMLGLVHMAGLFSLSRLPAASPAGGVVLPLSIAAVLVVLSVAALLPDHSPTAKVFYGIVALGIGSALIFASATGWLASRPVVLAVLLVPLILSGAWLVGSPGADTPRKRP